MRLIKFIFKAIVNIIVLLFILAFSFVYVVWILCG